MMKKFNAGRLLSAFLGLLLAALLAAQQPERVPALNG